MTTIANLPGRAARILCASIALAFPSHATLIGYESFAGISEANLDGQSTSSTTGYAGSETWDGSPYSNPAFSGSTTDLTYPGIASGGGSVEGFRNSSFSDTSVTARLTPATPTTNTPDALFFSFLVNADGYTARADDDATDGFEAYFWHSASSRNLGVGFGGESEGVDSAAKTLYVRGESGTMATDQVLQSGTNLVVLEISRPGGTGDNTYSVWLNPNVPAPGAAHWSGTQSFGILVGSGSSGFHGFGMEHEFNLQQTVQADEFRLGTTFDAVAPIPEPSTLVLFGLAGLGCVLSVMRKQK